MLAFDCGKEAGCSCAYTGARRWLRRTALTLCWYCCVVVVVFEGPLMHNSFLGEALLLLVVDAPMPPTTRWCPCHKAWWLKCLALCPPLIHLSVFAPLQRCSSRTYWCPWDGSSLSRVCSSSSEDPPPPPPPRHTHTLPPSLPPSPFTCPRYPPATHHCPHWW